MALGVEYVDLMLIHWPGVAKMPCDDIRNQQIRTGFYSYNRHLESTDFTTE